MGEIKFRAVIPGRNAIVYFDLKDLINPRFSVRELVIPWLLAGNEPDRYIGLKDRLGREVYEGDIIRWWNLTGGMHTEKVEYYVGTEGDGYQMAGFVLGCDWQEQFEIIGNIYKNPELVPSEEE